MNAVDRIITQWQEDGTATVLARVCARDATGAATGVPGEGKWVKQADLSAITCAVYDLSSATPAVAIATPTVTISSAILDTPATSSELWTEDTTGYNFIHDLASTNFPTGRNRYLVEYLFTTTGGAKWALQLEGVAHPVVGS